MSDEELRKIFKTYRTVVTVGLSSDPERFSNRVTSFLRPKGYRIIPVNPNETEVHGEKAYPDLASVPEPIELVQIFRKPEHVPAIVDEAIRLGAKVIWMQDGAADHEAADKAREAGLIVVEDDCMHRQFERLDRERPIELE
jgi:predicted CoA-binding protein